MLFNTTSTNPTTYNKIQTNLTTYATAHIISKRNKLEDKRVNISFTFFFNICDCLVFVLGVITYETPSYNI